MFLDPNRRADQNACQHGCTLRWRQKSPAEAGLVQPQFMASARPLLVSDNAGRDNGHRSRPSGDGLAAKCKRTSDKKLYLALRRAVRADGTDLTCKQQRRSEP